MALIVFAFFSVAFLVIIQGAMADLDRMCTSNITSYCLKFNTTRATYNGALYACYKLAYGANLVQPTFDSEFQAVRQVSSISGTQKCSKDGKSFYGTPSWIHGINPGTANTDWMIGQPIAPIGWTDCVAATPCGWQVMDCNSKLNYICFLP